MKKYFENVLAKFLEIVEEELLVLIEIFKDEGNRNDLTPNNIFWIEKYEEFYYRTDESSAEIDILIDEYSNIVAI